MEVIFGYSNKRVKCCNIREIYVNVKCYKGAVYIHICGDIGQGSFVFVIHVYMTLCGVKNMLLNWPARYS